MQEEILQRKTRIKMDTGLEHGQGAAAAHGVYKTIEEESSTIMTKGTGVKTDQGLLKKQSGF